MRTSGHPPFRADANAVTWPGALPTAGPFLRLRHALAIWLLAGLLASPALANGVPGFYSVVVNGIPQPDFALLDFDAEDRPYMEAGDFAGLRLARAVAPVLRNGMQAVPLYAQAGMEATVDGTQQVLSLELEPGWYAGTRMNLRAPRLGTPVAAPPGAVLNYSLQASRSGQDRTAFASSQSLSVFGPEGLLLVTTAISSTAAANATGGSQAGRRFSRLGTTWLRDDEARLSTLALGDGVLLPAAGVPAVRYGGISWQTNFGLEPAFSTLETPAIFDEARLPSTLEFYLNDRRVGAPVAVPPGPFEITGLPTVDASGQVKVVIRDALNNERTVAVPYIHYARVYRQGLHSFNYTAGLLRPELDRYQTPFLATSHRWGATRWLTLDAGAAFSAGSSSLGGGATFPLKGNLVADASLALARSVAGTGSQAGASLQWQAGVASAGASLSHASAAFRLLGDAALPSSRPRDDLRLFASRALDHDLGSVSASYGRLSTWDTGARAIVSAGWSRSFRFFGVSLGGLHTREGTTAILTFSLPLGPLGFASSSLQQQGATAALRAEYATVPVTDTGFAYRVGASSTRTAGNAGQHTVFGSVDARSPWGEHGLDLEARSDGNAVRVRTAGSVGMLAGRTFAGPPISGGFALVSTGDAPGIPVYRWNLPVAVSDSRGLALVTNLNPYQDNLLAVKPEEVPLEYRVTSNEVTAVPRGRGGVYVAFAMLREHPGVLLLRLPDGQPVPPGASVKVIATGESASVGLRGEAYLLNLPERAEVKVSDNGRLCRIMVTRPAGTDPQPRLGPYRCDLERKP